MSDHQVRVRSRRAALLQLAAEEVRRLALEEGEGDGPLLARHLERLAARVLVGVSRPACA